ncbi:hypothetical protein AAG570_007319 [Ranatra chinensis]|uniref:K Homology domain-containing protein n=1 Tax=Ranatra chinensis TaxID=642074 RepID=A0ABD0YAP3_9HEMI
MKRNPDGNSMGPQKRFRSAGGGGMSTDEPSLRILIPSKVAGSIIGKGGKNISRLRTTYKASVSLPDCPGPERVVLISGELETAVKVVEDIVPNLEEYFRNQGKNDADLRLLVHQSLAGCVIGKAGAKIKELREKTGAKIKIFGSCCPHSTDRVISIVGSVQVCCDAVKEVVELVKETPTKGYSEMYDPRNYDDEYAEEYGGFGVAPGPRGGGGGMGGGRGGGGRGPPPMGPPGPRGGRGPMPPPPPDGPHNGGPPHHHPGHNTQGHGRSHHRQGRHQDSQDQVRFRCRHHDRRAGPRIDREDNNHHRQPGSSPHGAVLPPADCTRGPEDGQPLLKTRAALTVARITG